MCLVVVRVAYHAASCMWNANVTDAVCQAVFQAVFHAVFMTGLGPAAAVSDVTGLCQAKTALAEDRLVRMAAAADCPAQRRVCLPAVGVRARVRRRRWAGCRHPDQTRPSSLRCIATPSRPAYLPACRLGLRCSLGLLLLCLVYTFVGFLSAPCPPILSDFGSVGWLALYPRAVCLSVGFPARRSLSLVARPTPPFRVARRGPRSVGQRKRSTTTLIYTRHPDRPS